MTNHTQTGERVYRIVERGTEKREGDTDLEWEVTAGSIRLITGPESQTLTDQEAGQIAEAMQAAYDESLARVLGARRKTLTTPIKEEAGQPATVRETSIEVKSAQVMACARNVLRVCKELYDRPVLS